MIDLYFLRQCNFLGIKKENVAEVPSLDFQLDDLCRMDFIQHFIGLRELTLNNQGIQVMEVSNQFNEFLDVCSVGPGSFEASRESVAHEQPL